MSRETALRVLEIESQAIMALGERLDDSFDRALDLLQRCQGRVVVSGMGKSGIIGQKPSVEDGDGLVSPRDAAQSRSPRVRRVAAVLVRQSVPARRI